ncbi:radical SAM protein [Marinifilum fragile]|uniref:radical SAM protein n=1 Tax=Marinifilum fragile TaxID=570161 RepID=UPI002AA7672B|nr:radical SAM protein [Marinifilum fragile]
MPSRSESIKDIFVLVTNKCNLRCSYCYEIEKNSDVISTKLLIEELKKELESSLQKYKLVNIVFHGGEPFLAFEEMKEVSEWAWANFPNNKVMCLATTNGTILTDEIKDWLTENKKRFYPTLSLDGGKEDHNLNRSNSFDRIDFEFFKKNWPNLPVKMTTAPNTISRMFDNFLEIHKMGFLVNPSLAHEVDWSLEEHLPLYAKELNKICQFYVENPKIEPSNNVALKLEYFSPEFIIKHKRACGAGFNVLAFDVKGCKYPCHAFISDLTKKYEKEKVESIFDKLSADSGVELSKECENCFVFTACSPCYGLNHSYRGDMAKFDPVMCEFTKIRVLASANLHAKMLKNRVKYKLVGKKTDNQLYHLIKGIEEIYKKINISI